MKRPWVWLPAGILAMLLAGAASATPIILFFEGATSVGGQLPVGQTYDPAAPIEGSGDIDFVAGTGTLTLPDYSVFLDAGVDGTNDARLDIVGWAQTITSIDAAGNLTTIASGSQSCTALGGFGNFICPSVPTTVASWPPAGATSSAVLDDLLQTITIIDNSNPAAGTVTAYYSYSIIPEPGTALLLGAGLAIMATRRRVGLS